jgi:hypothetical protein
LDDDVYPYLSDAQRYVMGQLSIHVPEINRPVKELMTTADDGLTYTLSAEPIGRVDIYYNLRSGTPLTPVEPWNTSGDFEWEGEKTIRMVGNRTRTFPEGPYAHYVAEPGPIDADNEPVILPAFIRVLIPYRAAIEYVSEGALGDPTHFHSLYQITWAGDPLKRGDIGILGELKIRYGKQNGASRPFWWHSPDLSTLPVGFNS